MAEQFVEVTALHPVLYWLHQHLDPRQDELAAIREPIDAVIGPKDSEFRFPDSILWIPAPAAEKLASIVATAINGQDPGNLNVPLVEEGRTDHEGHRVKNIPAFMLTELREQLLSGQQVRTGRNAGMSA